jgi:steroid 5-alpha reductase family enzyme
MMLVVAEEAFWPTQAVACAVILAVLGVLFRYLWLVRRRRGSAGGAVALVWGVVLLALSAVVALQGKEVTWPAAGMGVLLVAGGIRAHRTARRRS